MNPLDTGWMRYATYGGFGILALTGVFILFMTALQAKGKSKTSGAVVGIVGRMGSGKSFAAVRMALDRLERGVDVVSNFRIDTEGLGLAGNWSPFKGWEQLAEIKNAVVIVDEAHLYAPSHQHVRFPMVARQALAFGRKNGIDLFWISQHEDRVNKTLKDLTTTMMLTTAYFSGSFFVVKGWEPEQFRKPKKHLFRRVYRFNARIGAAYDTTELIEVDEHALIGDSSASTVRSLQERRAQGRKSPQTALEGA